MTETQTNKVSRRGFLKSAIEGGLASAIVLRGFPSIVPASVFGSQAPCNQITVGAIGTGRISRTHDLPGVLRYENARVIAVCDLDSKRVEDAKKLVNEYYSQQTGKPYDGVTGYANYRE